MPANVRERLEHILEATANIRALLAGKSIENALTTISVAPFKIQAFAMRPMTSRPKDRDA